MNRERGALLRPDVETATRGAMLRAPTDKFMESHNDFRITHWDHEPPWWSAGLRPGEFGDIARIAPDRRSALQFMGSLDLQQVDAHWNHEPTAGSLSPTEGEDQGEGHGSWRGA